MKVDKFCGRSVLTIFVISDTIDPATYKCAEGIHAVLTLVNGGYTICMSRSFTESASDSISFFSESLEESMTYGV